ncbi:Na(+)-translocating NADH-quinone reductase subunit C [Brumicola pallidula]|uniref:Na(+)-translocating NADH-quinone reductase subunit C n=1 Tax=Brumicola pallidula DSM 14239 = ACAM 615 TaxID=1121922 RepID=K7A111_9ALTE|nr:Na(+)-translocating NADH-quinone reductase subunit C [Glaciecola pallidula]GAC29210.1 Na+-transporting NADH:ubiquinone oxidoreductase subunit C [Glaciecola pallidula DSM 14239 = ACAM 615]
MSAKKETLGKTVGVVVAVCLVCSIIVSGAAVGLRELQQANAALDRQSNILAAAGLLGEAKTKKEIGIVYDARVVERFVNLTTGEYVANPAEGESKPYDMYGRVSKAPETSTKAEGSPAGFSRRANVASIFLIKDDDGVVSRIILPVHGSGLWDLMFGFLALDSDGHTIRELIFYQHKETPGLGGEIQNPEWQAKWNGKQLFKNGNVAIEVNKGDNRDNQYAVDALSGATLTSNGVENTLEYWASDNGYGNYLKKQSWKS